MKFFLAYGKVYLVRKRGGIDHGKLYAMKVLRKAVLVQKKKSAEHTKTEREVSLTNTQNLTEFHHNLIVNYFKNSKIYLVLSVSIIVSCSSN